MLYKNTSIEVVVGIIHNSNNEVFIAKRQKNQFMAGYWELPGGKVEPGEDHLSAIKRELFEETGIIVKRFSISILKKPSIYRFIVLMIILVNH